MRPRKRDPGLHLAALRLPSTFTASNAVFLSAGDILIEGHPTGGPAAHAGAAFHAGGAIKLEGSHSFTACDAAPETTMPELKVIRHVVAGRLAL